MNGYIYEIRNIQNNKVYIGQTWVPENRQRRHFSDLRNQRHDNPHLQKAFIKYGEENFVFNILLEIPDCSQQLLDEKEIAFIKQNDSYLNGYNCNKGGQGVHAPTSKFSKEDVFVIKAVSKFYKKYGSVLAEHFNTSNTSIYRINHNSQCGIEGKEFDLLPEEEQKQLADEFVQKHDLIHKRHDKMPKLTSRRQFSKDQIFWVYIYQEFGNGKPCFLSKDLGVNSCNTLRCIRKHETYQDYYDEYCKLTLEEKLAYLCHYMETYNRKPPELLETLVKRQSAAKPK